jgi:HEPN domain-containing protein
MTKTRLFKKEYARELLAVALGDLETAEALAKIRIKRTENLLFHAQQAIEKSLKACLCWEELPIPMVHDLAVIVDHLPKGAQPPHADEISDLTQFATVRRYEEGVAQFSPQEIAEVLAAANAICQWAKMRIGQ